MLLETPKFSAVPFRDFEISEPCSGGLNLLDLEYEQDISQSPRMLNMMYRNGAFGKRYGQKYQKQYEGEVYSVGSYGDEIVVHEGKRARVGDKIVAQDLPEEKGLWINFNRILYYLCSAGYFQYDSTNGWKKVTPYEPDLVINRKPDASYAGDTVENYNRLGSGFKNTFHGDGTSTKYILTDKKLDDTAPKVEVDGKLLTADKYTFNRGDEENNGFITFNEAPPKGTNNVVITVYKTQNEYISSIIRCKYYCTYGGNNNSRLFLAGGGDSKYYYSDVYDGTYFPEMNYAQLGNGEDDITGFGEQYDVLIVFKPKEIFSISYYIDANKKGTFTSKQVNSAIGCDAPDSIQLINNQLVWLSSEEGVCTLTSTNIQDERNVRPISRNINGGYRKSGLLQEKDLSKAKSADYDGKYILSVNGNAYVWDYLMRPYVNTGKPDQDAKRLAWFLFDRFMAKDYVKCDGNLYYSVEKNLVVLDSSFNDFGQPIKAMYQTPLLQFGAVEYLKTIKDIYVQCRADTASVINMKYITEENPNGEVENEPIRIGERLWLRFGWETFAWSIVNFGNVFRRKCSLKKIQMAGVLFENNELNRDMSISHLSFKYTIVKNVK